MEDEQQEDYVPTELEKELASAEINKVVAEGFKDEQAVSEHNAEIERLKIDIRKERIGNALADMAEDDTTK